MAGPSPIRTSRLTLVSVSADLLDALLLGHRERAERLGALHLPEGWPPPEDTGFLLLRRQDLRDHPDWQPWLLRAMVLRGPEPRLVGHLGFHGPPDAKGRLEVGYEVLPPWRRQGYAREAVTGLLTWAAAQPGVTGFVASVSPENAPSLRLAEQLGFVRMGEHIDERDGLEWELERAQRR